MLQSVSKCCFGVCLLELRRIFPQILWEWHRQQVASACVLQLLSATHRRGGRETSGEAGAGSWRGVGCLKFRDLGELCKRDTGDRRAARLGAATRGGFGWASVPGLRERLLLIVAEVLLPYLPELWV